MIEKMYKNTRIRRLNIDYFFQIALICFNYSKKSEIYFYLDKRLSSTIIDFEMNKYENHNWNNIEFEMIQDIYIVMNISTIF